MRKYKSVLAIVFFAIGGVLVLIPQVPKFYGVISLCIGLVFTAFASAGTFTFTRASKTYMTKQTDEGREKALLLFEKAYNLGLPDEYAISAGSIILQWGSIEKGRQILESLLKSKDKKTQYNAYVSLSMYYWITKNTKKAIELCERAENFGIQEQNLFINMGTYTLAEGDIKKFKKTLSDCYKAKKVTNATMDLEATEAILESDFERAGNQLTTMMDLIKPNYQDPYIHLAMVYAHYGEFKKAADILSDYSESATYSNTTLFKNDEIDKFISVLENPDLAPSFKKAVDDKPLLFINGILPEFTPGVKYESYPALPRFKKVKFKAKDVVLEEKGPNTDLTDEDEEWLKKHNHN